MKATGCDPRSIPLYVPGFLRYLSLTAKAWWGDNPSLFGAIWVLSLGVKLSLSFREGIRIHELVQGFFENSGTSLMTFIESSTFPPCYQKSARKVENRKNHSWGKPRSLQIYKS